MIKEKKLLKELSSLKDKPYFDSWYAIVKDILLDEEFDRRHYFPHHNKSVWEHSVLVSFTAYRYSFIFKADHRVCAIAGLLHDFYPYAWQYSAKLESIDPKYLSKYKQKVPFFKKHGFVHAKEAADNYILYYPKLKDKKVTNAIKRHMFPLNIIPPRYKESWIITLADKKVAFSEFRIKDLIYYCGLKKK